MMKNKTLLLPALLIIFVLNASAKRLPETIVKIGILVKVSSFNLSCESSYYVYEINSGDKTKIKTNNDYLVRPSGSSRIKFDGSTFTSPIRLISDVDLRRIKINGKRYRDNVLIFCKNGKLTAVNELGLEDYLYGILPREVSPAWPMESLKTQAIVSRTYALRNLGRHKSEGYDLCSTVHCQVYGGIESEDERTNKAVKITRGQVLTYNGELAKSFFHAACAGHTEDPKFVWTWSDSIPDYLKGRKDKFCSGSPHNYWKKQISAVSIQSSLNKAGYKVGSISKIQKAGTTTSGRVNYLKIRHSKGTLTINAAKFRLAVSPWLIKSTLISSIVKYKDYFEFRGRGWGHAVGLCQWGAKGMAEKGYNYKEILHYYFPGTKVETWEE